MWIEHEDGGEPLMRFDAQLGVQRPIGVPEGIEMRTVLAVNAAYPFEVGGYRVVADLDGTRRAYSFRVVARPPV